jgi:rhodanese-related sulfurtransferase
MSVSVISPKQLQDRIQAGEQVHLIDVRTPAEFREVHVTMARNTPLESLIAEPCWPLIQRMRRCM